MCAYLVSGRKCPVEIYREHNISDSLCGRWRQQFTEQAPKIFESKHRANSGLVQAITELERLGGRLILELSTAKNSQVTSTVGKRETSSGATSQRRI